jgi:hypothetical protein
MERLFMETTKIEAEQTVAEIKKILGKYGAGAVMTEQEVFMPYIQVSITGQTLYEKFEEKGLSALEDKR